MGKLDDEATEKAALGCMLLTPDLIHAEGSTLTVKDFFHTQCATVFAAMQSVTSNGYACEPMTVAKRLHDTKFADRIGGTAFIMSLTDRIPSTAHFPQMVKRLRKLRKARHAQSKATEILALLEQGISAEEFNKRAVVLAEEITADDTADDTETIRLYDACTNALDQRSEKTGALFAFRNKALRRVIPSCRAGQVIVIGARPAMGKSAVALQMLREACEDTGKGGLHVSLEMKAEEHAIRVLNGDARLPAFRLNALDITDEEVASLAATQFKYRDLPLEFSRSQEVSLGGLRTMARKIKAKHGLCAIVVDYLQLMTITKNRSGTLESGSRTRELSELSRAMKALAMELECTLIVLSQINRKSADGEGPKDDKDFRPKVHHLRESGAIEQDADVILLLYREEVHNKETTEKGVMEIDVAKQRGGPTDVVRVRFDATACLIHDLDIDAPIDDEKEEHEPKTDHPAADRDAAVRALGARAWERDPGAFPPVDASHPLAGWGGVVGAPVPSAPPRFEQRSLSLEPNRPQQGYEDAPRGDAGDASE